MQVASSVSVLIVDDNVAIARALVLLLQAKGISVDSVNGGHEALAWLERNDAKLIILDLSMPDLSGVEVLKIIRADPAHHDIPVVLHSALEANAVDEIARRHGANAVLHKGDSTLVDVLKLIETHLCQQTPSMP